MVSVFTDLVQQPMNHGNAAKLQPIIPSINNVANKMGAQKLDTQVENKQAVIQENKQTVIKDTEGITKRPDLQRQLVPDQAIPAGDPPLLKGNAAQVQSNRTVNQGGSLIRAIANNQQVEKPSNRTI